MWLTIKKCSIHFYYFQRIRVTVLAYSHSHSWEIMWIALTGRDNAIPCTDKPTSILFSRLWPNHSSSHNNIGTLLEDLNEAERHFRRAIAINPCHSKAYYNLASIYRYVFGIIYCGKLPTVIVFHLTFLIPLQ